jgi:hypothetical protein
MAVAPDDMTHPPNSIVSSPSLRYRGSRTVPASFRETEEFARRKRGTNGMTKHNA